MTLRRLVWSSAGPRPWCFAPLLLAWGLACGASPAPEPASPASPPRSSAAAVAPALPLLAADPNAEGRLRADVTALAAPALEGRGTGEKGARMAADFVAARFAELGLTPRGDGPSAAYLQRFEAKVGAIVEPPRLEVVGARKPLAVNAYVTAEGAETGDVTAETVFVGHGITAKALGWDDYAKVDVKGKLAVILDGTPPPRDGAAPLRDFGTVRYKIRTAREHGAVGVVLVADRLPNEPVDASSMGLPAVVLTRDAALVLFATLDPSAVGAPPRGKKAPSMRVATRLAPRLGEAWNVLASLPADPASPTRDEVLVIGAHYDHLGFGGPASRAPGNHSVHPGADDNASGTAFLLEVARRLAAGPRLPRTVLFAAFGAEELGAIGSRYLVEHPPVPVASMVAMLNADMVGRLRGNRLVVDGVGTAADWEPLVREAGAGLGLDFAFGSEGFGASDHTSFTTARVPVAFFFTGVHDDYHMPTDTADRIQTEGLARISLLGARLALSVAQRKDRLVFVDAPPDPHAGPSGGRGGFRVSLGTIPDYAFSGKGVLLSGTRPDSPSSRAGLLAGDVLVKVGEHAITNVHDYVFALGDLEPGKEVTVEVLRAGATVTLKVIPAPGR